LDQVNHHKPQVQRVDYSPLMVESDEDSFVKEERWLKAILILVPPSIFHCDIMIETPFIEGFR
jgi:hypothetical protein